MSITHYCDNSTTAEKLADTAQSFKLYDTVYVSFEKDNLNILEFKVELIKKYDVTPYGDRLWVVRERVESEKKVTNKRARTK